MKSPCWSSLFAVLVLTAGHAFGQTPPTLPAGAEQAADAITRDVIEAPIRFLSDDLLEGRGPASRGDELARLYIASQLEQIGLQPGAANNGWQQPFDIVGINAALPATWNFTTRGGEVGLKKSEEYVAFSGVQAESAKVESADLVFVGYGIEAPEYRWNDYKGANLKGKVLVMLNNDPDWDPKLFEGNRRLYYGRWTYKYESAARQGAAGAIIIHTVPSAGYPWQVVQSSWTGEQFELPAENEPRMQIKGWMTEAAARRLLQSAGHDFDKLVQAAHTREFKPVSLGATTSFSLKNEVSKKTTANVMGLLPGNDPALADEVVVYSAHHDHLGVGDPDSTGDTIYNGALDNASGVGQVLAIAQAYAALPKAPRRSVLFLFVAAEEQGLLGSQYYAQHPTFPAGKIAANINYDGANIWGRARDVALIGHGKSTLDRVAEFFATKQGRTVKGDQFPDRGFYYRSDQFNFAKIGVPALYLDTGAEFVDRPEGWGKQRIEEWEAKNYHQPSDELTKEWNFDGMIDDARLGFFSGLALAQAEEMPSWVPGDEFEAARKKAIAASKETPAKG